MTVKNWGNTFLCCVECGKVDRPHHAKGRCWNCYRGLLRKVCSICSKFNVIARRDNEKAICNSCNKKYYYVVKKRECSICGDCRRVAKIDQGKDICDYCHTKYYHPDPKRKCYGCGEIREANLVLDGNFYCGFCYRHRFYEKPRFNCDFCGKFGKTSAIRDDKRMCHKCYKNLRKEHFHALELGWRDKRKKYLSDEEIKSIVERDKNCVYCGSSERLSFDHIVPISKGGKSELNNLVIACMKCNLSKNRSDVKEWCKHKGEGLPGIVKDLLKKQEAAETVR